MDKDSEETQSEQQIEARLRAEEHLNDLHRIRLCSALWFCCTVCAASVHVVMQVVSTRTMINADGAPAPIESPVRQLS